MKKSLLIIGIVLSMSLISCGKSDNNMNDVIYDNEEETVNQTNEEKIDTGEIIFNKETLAIYNGKDGMAGYVAVDGIVYDVTDVVAWQSLHAGQFEPGKDYSDEIRQSPHGLKNLKKLKVVGGYEE
ncbi:MAG: hypothetical protein JEZ08_09530 [Clostridiales bacterium]|nr:hypothetical protein [Clostridiales bacterium]